MLKKTIFTCFIFLIFSSLEAQNINYDTWIYQFTSWETSCNYEAGSEEYTRNGWLEVENVGTNYSGCQQCTANGDCTSTGVWSYHSYTNQSVYARIRCTIDAWEDDIGDRCTYSTGTFNSDDCRTNITSGWYNLPTPVEYQWTNNYGNVGDADHRADFEYRSIYTTTTIPNAVENSTFGFTTGGNRPFWGSQGSWATVGSDCATSGTITHDETSSFSTTVSCIDQVTFRWNVSSETNYDFLRFFINGVEQSRISGTPGWATLTFNLDPNIDNTIEWRYTKDASVSSNLDRGFVDQITYRNYIIPTVGTNFGSNVWNVSCYNGRNFDLSGVTYRGYYTDNNLNINTQNFWNSGTTPSSAANYNGCSVNEDNHTTVHKRQGFPCGTYRMDIANHDDEIKVYINGVQVYEHLGCCDSHTGVWTGVLSSNSTVEVRTAEGGGGSNTGVNLVPIAAPINVGTINGNQTICSGTIAHLGNTVAASGGHGTLTYQWQVSTTNCSGGWSNIGGATGVTHSQNVNQTSYFRRGAVDICGNTSYTNCVTVNMAVEPGNPAIFGSNEWNVYAYNGQDLNLGGGLDYRGYYVDNNLNVNTASYWPITPSSAAGYNGCFVNNDYHTTVHKRQGFPCSIYQIDITGHDDEIRIYVDGTQVYEHLGCCDSHTSVWTGFLNTNSTVEIRTAEGIGGSITGVNLIPIASLINAGTINGSQTICSGTTILLGHTIAASGGHGTLIYQWQVSTTNCSSGWSNIGGATGATHSQNVNQTSYFRRRISDACGNVSYSNCITVTRNVNSTAPNSAIVSGEQCPNTDITLTASGGIAGTASNIYWYSGPNGTGSFLGSGSTLIVSPSVSTIYYARREGACNTSADALITVNVKSYIYSPVGVTSSSSYCTDNNGWHHFFNGSDEIVLSIQGDLSGTPSGFPQISINNNGSFYSDIGSPGSCSSNLTPGEAKIEMGRNWNVDFGGGIPNPPYNVRFYFNPTERTVIENEAANLIASYSLCAYTYKYPNPNGFYWFKNTTSNYLSPQYDGVHINGAVGTTSNSLNYVELSGVLSFSGGTGGITLVPSATLPVELISFEAKAINNEYIQLDWSTATEINNEGFEIERSINGVEFTKIDFVNGNGNSTIINNYQFEDREVNKNITYYYRLKQVDYDGEFEYSEIVTAQLEGKDKFSIGDFRPNPTKENTLTTVTIISTKEETIKVSAYNSIGVNVLNLTQQLKVGSNEVIVSTENLSSGTYFINFEGSFGRETKRLVVVK